MNGLHETLALRIKYYARQRGLGLTELAETVGRSHLFDVMAGRKSPTLDWLATLAEVLEVEVWELLKPARRRKRPLSTP